MLWNLRKMGAMYARSVEAASDGIYRDNALMSLPEFTYDQSGFVSETSACMLG